MKSKAQRIRVLWSSISLFLSKLKPLWHASSTHNALRILREKPKLSSYSKPTSKRRHSHSGTKQVCISKRSNPSSKAWSKGSSNLTGQPNLKVYQDGSIRHCCGNERSQTEKHCRNERQRASWEGGNCRRSWKLRTSECYNKQLSTNNWERRGKSTTRSSWCLQRRKRIWLLN